MTGDILTCVYCGAAYPEGTPPHGSKVLTDHIRVCEKHPMRELERKLGIALNCLKLAYRKHTKGDPDIGWDELGDDLWNTLCILMGDEEFTKWNEET